MSFQRTRMSADRTLMSVMRTSFSLISFGFTIFQFFAKVNTSNAASGGGSAAPRHFGIALVVIGIVMLVFGIIYQLQFMHDLRAERANMAQQGLIHAESHFPPSMTLVTAIILLLFGLLAIASMAFNLPLF